MYYNVSIFYRKISLSSWLSQLKREREIGVVTLFVRELKSLACLKLV